MRKEICIAGFGGQGVVLAAYILGKALSIYDGFEVVMTQSYGPEARGGASSANLVISDEPIDYPLVEHPDILMILSQEAYTRFRPTAQIDALTLIDEGLVVPFVDDQPSGIPATSLAEGLGRRVVANVVMLGFFTAVTELANKVSLEQSIAASVKSKTVPLNLKAFEQGFSYAREKNPREYPK